MSTISTHFPFGWAQSNTSFIPFTTKLNNLQLYKITSHRDPSFLFNPDSQVTLLELKLYKKYILMQFSHGVSGGTFGGHQEGK